MYSDKYFKKFREILKENPSAFFEDYKKIYKQVQNSTAIYDGEPIDFLYQPMFYDKEDVKLFKDNIQKLFDILEKVIEKYKSNPDFREFFDFPKIMEKLILKDPGYGVNIPIARFDIFYNNEKIMFCELNTDGSSAMNEARVLQKLFQDSLVFKKMEDQIKFYNCELFESWIDKVIENYNNFSDNPKSCPNIAIVDFKNEGTIYEFKEFKKRFIKRGYETVICDPRELSYKNKTLYYKDFPIDIIYRRATTARIVEESEQIQDFIHSYLEGAVCVIGGFVSQIPHNKIIFSILHDRKKVSFLNKEEYNFIKDHIPFTAELVKGNKELIQKISQNKNQYILKPSDWFACHGVYAGKDFTQKEWENKIEDSVNNKYIVQKYIKVPQKKMPTINRKQEHLKFENYNFITGLFLYNQELNGLYTRVGRKNIIGSLVESFTLPSFITAKRRLKDG